VLEQLREREMLHRTILNRDTKNMDNSDDEDEEDEEIENEQDAKLRAKALLTQIEDDSTKKTNGKKGGLFAMKFMQTSLERQRMAALERARALVQDLEGETKKKTTTQGQSDGVRKFGKNNTKKNYFTNSSITKEDKEAVESALLESKTSISKSTTFQNSFETPKFASSSDSSNPWLTSQSSKVKGKTRSKAHETKLTTEPDVLDVVEVTKKMMKDQEKQDNDDDEQRDLVKQAFVNSGVNQEAFLKEKKKIIEHQLQDITKDDGPIGVAGWGSWAGDGVTISSKSRKRRQRREDRAERLKEIKRQKIAASRKDSNKKNVIISEKRNKAAAQFTVKTVPYPFKSRAQYEASLRRAVGGELNTSRMVDRDTKPEVYTRAGVIITPARLPRRKFRT